MIKKRHHAVRNRPDLLFADLGVFLYTCDASFKIGPFLELTSCCLALLLFFLLFFWL